MTHQQPWLLMCPPDFYAIEYEINPWMSRSRGANRARAMRQWHSLYQTLLDLGVQVSLVDPVPALPDMVFTANAGMIFRKMFIASSFRPKVRVGEVPYFEAWFEVASFQVHRLSDGLFFEGAGDALFCGPILFGGYRIRSDARSHQQIANLVGCEVLPLELVDPRFYHLDTCFCPLAMDASIWYPDAFDSYGQQVIRQNVADLIEATSDDALRFGCNAVVIGRTVIMPAGCVTLRSELESRGLAIRELELDEFLKAGGSAKCLTLRIDGEEAAAWRSANLA